MKLKNKDAAYLRKVANELPTLYRKGTSVKRRLTVSEFKIENPNWQLELTKLKNEKGEHSEEYKSQHEILMKKPGTHQIVITVGKIEQNHYKQFKKMWNAAKTRTEALALVGDYIKRVNQFVQPKEKEEA